MLSTRLRSRMSNSSSEMPAHSLGVEILGESTFSRMLCFERKRVERSGRRFVLVLLEWERLVRLHEDAQVREQVLKTLVLTTRDTDIKGWYKEDSTFGILFTEIGHDEGTQVARTLLARITDALGSTLSVEEIGQVKISFHVYPHEVIEPLDGGAPDFTLYPDETQKNQQRRVSLFIKRSLDILGSLAIMVSLVPLVTLIALAVKLTSPGPVLFRQERIGLFGRKFTFLKFRSMYVANDESLHKEFVTKFIDGEIAVVDLETNNGSFKMKNDPRVTPVGKFLRRTSLDELPQFWNVLVGDMSIVGPRPPVPYEYDRYNTWHRRRLLTVKPGITGLWQVCGRSRVRFDEMVRLDLLYAQNWSLWLDLEILAKTPGAVFGGSGAY